MVRYRKKMITRSTTTRYMFCSRTRREIRTPFKKKRTNASVTKNNLLSRTREKESSETRNKRKERPVMTTEENNKISSIVTPRGLWVSTIKKFVYLAP
jgi:hypothetical protein